MASKKKGPRQHIGLKCSECSTFGYVTSMNKNNELLKKQGGETTFPLSKYCSKCRKHTSHVQSKKLK
ncbi:MAG: 50S ribosomal protein L33 [Candidatus Pacebacteria bacterium]|nr:50S ribosomal protein L33 [Candidatus Paceibacterota bacterium]PIR63590.1 MAG: 50S ribosomal protein L33 [Candidatus Pacebacteria bacterium CG10_big_fil_rev_8_21_14_0_10_40_26]PIZ79343.1 MAG: 50S ribosomal protein L33 [Candidatus Pacebacteria bacterium CG_4_10_14_0_2_um_filter_40_20]PJA68852.1 MAG: 50S ribosomal protein L33 [Candidatus Pacebacteria bacterium CG_4_9_14_3_um_filter_40_12]PJC42163.1 MAG: 50S ribosomal protein L33 [Candidatus Pacebacteria bacterium CG_4_9_14_0_2_um_filter_40_15]